MRHELYRNVHKGLRAELTRLLTDTGTADPADRHASQQLGSRFDELAFLLERHAYHEATHFHPVLALASRSIATRLDAEHIAAEALVAPLKEAYAGLATDDQLRNQDAFLDTYRMLAHFCASYFAHLEYEESVAMHALWSALSDEELISLDARLIRSIPRETLVRFMRALLPAMNALERTELLGALRAIGPRESFEGTLEVARGLIAAREFQSLRQGLVSP
jgi:hypothetical protein